MTFVPETENRVYQNFTTMEGRGSTSTDDKIVDHELVKVRRFDGVFKKIHSSRKGKRGVEGFLANQIRTISGKGKPKRLVRYTDIVRYFIRDMKSLVSEQLEQTQRERSM